MAAMTLSDLSKKMADIDFCMLQTAAEGGSIAARPMSNNGDVDYEGDSYFFTWETSRMAADIERDPQVAMSFTGNSGPDGHPPIFIAVQGQAQILRNRQAFGEHWDPDLERWFEQGVDTPGMVMIKVHATRVNYWDGEGDGELVP